MLLTLDKKYVHVFFSVTRHTRSQRRIVMWNVTQMPRVKNLIRKTLLPKDVGVLLVDSSIPSIWWNRIVVLLCKQYLRR